MKRWKRKVSKIWTFKSVFLSCTKTCSTITSSTPTSSRTYRTLTTWSVVQFQRHLPRSSGHVPSFSPSKRVSFSSNWFPSLAPSIWTEAYTSWDSSSSRSWASCPLRIRMLWSCRSRRSLSTAPKSSSARSTSWAKSVTERSLRLNTRRSRAQA